MRRDSMKRLLVIGALLLKSFGKRSSDGRVSPIKTSKDRATGPGPKPERGGMGGTSSLRTGLIILLAPAGLLVVLSLLGYAEFYILLAGMAGPGFLLWGLFGMVVEYFVRISIRYRRDRKRWAIAFLRMQRLALTEPVPYITPWVFAALEMGEFLFAALAPDAYRSLYERLGLFRTLVAYMYVGCFGLVCMISAFIDQVFWEKIKRWAGVREEEIWEQATGDTKESKLGGMDKAPALWRRGLVYGAFTVGVLLALSGLFRDDTLWVEVGIALLIIALYARPRL
jgi:hypothetical protein